MMENKNFIISKDGKILVRYEGSEKNIIIPDGVIRIDDYAFIGCSSLESIVIPDSVKSIGAEAFFQCSSLTSITMGTEIKIIWAGAFKCCKNLIKNGKFKAFEIIKNGLYCLDKKYEENKWHCVKGELKLCANGLHYVDNLYEIFNYYAGEIDEDFAIYEIETRGEDIKDPFSSKHCCRSIKLKRRIYREELIKMLNGEI